MGIYGKIFKTAVSKFSGEKKAKVKTSKNKKMKLKKLTPEQKQKFVSSLKKVTSAVSKYEGGKPKVKVTPAPTKRQEAVNFWNSPIDMGFIKPTGKQLVIGGTGTAIGIYALYRILK